MNGIAIKCVRNEPLYCPRVQEPQAPKAYALTSSILPRGPRTLSHAECLLPGSLQFLPPSRQAIGLCSNPGRSWNHRSLLLLPAVCVKRIEVWDAVGTSVSSRISPFCPRTGFLVSEVIDVVVQAPGLAAASLVVSSVEYPRWPSPYLQIHDVITSVVIISSPLVVTQGAPLHSPSTAMVLLPEGSGQRPTTLRRLTSGMNHGIHPLCLGATTCR